MPFAIEGTDPSTGGAAPCNFSLFVNCFRGVLDVTAYSEVGAPDSFDLFVPNPSAAIDLVKSVNFASDTRICGEGRMIVFVGHWPTLANFSGEEPGQ